MLKYLGGAALALALTAPAFAAPVEVVTKVMAEKRTTAPDGTTRIALAPAGRITPGDRVVYQISYRNTGAQPVSDFVVTNPLPSEMTYIAVAGNSAAPEMSVDGTTFAPLAALRVKLAGGGSRAAIASDVRILRWRIARPLAAGTAGQVSFSAMLR